MLWTTRLPLGAGLAAYLVAMAVIRRVTRAWDWVVLMRLAVAGAILALAGGGLAPLILVAIVSALLIGEAAIELRRAPPPERGRPPHALPFEETNQSRAS